MWQKFFQKLGTKFHKNSVGRSLQRRDAEVVQIVFEGCFESTRFAGGKSIAVENDIALLFLDGFRRDHKVQTHTDFRILHPFHFSVDFKAVTIE